MGKKNKKQHFVMLSETGDYTATVKRKGKGLDYLQTWTMKTGPSPAWSKPGSTLFTLEMDGNGKIVISGNINLTTDVSDLADLYHLIRVANLHNPDLAWFDDVTTYKGMK